MFYSTTLHNRAETFTAQSRTRVDLSVGRLVFSMLRLGESTVGIIEGFSPRVGELALGFDYAAAPRRRSPEPVPLRPDDRVLLGSRGGALICGPNSEVDEERTALLTDTVLQQAMQADDSLSKVNTRVIVGVGYRVSVLDLNSANGTGLSFHALLEGS
jgi:hypothetical protein